MSIVLYILIINKMTDALTRCNSSCHSRTCHMTREDQQSRPTDHMWHSRCGMLQPARGHHHTPESVANSTSCNLLEDTTSRESRIEGMAGCKCDIDRLRNRTCHMTCTHEHSSCHDHNENMNMYVVAM